MAQAMSARLSASALVFALLLGAAAPAFAVPSQQAIDSLAGASKLEVQSFTLKNGLRVYVIPDHRAPVVTQMIWYEIGSADEVPGKSGLAHFLEHLMFKGTKKIPPGQFSKIIARNGGQNNAFTSWDYTAYYERVAKDRLPLVMKMEADRAANLQLTDKIVYPERDVIIEERRQRTDDSPTALLAEQMDAALYENSRYGVPVIGWLREMQGLTTKDALGWYHTYYAPNNAFLVVAGDVTADGIKPLVEKTYGRLRRAKTPPRTRAHEPKQNAERRVIVRDARAEQPYFARTYHAPNERDAKTAAALDVAAKILGGSATSRLHKALVIDKPLAAAARASYWSVRIQEGEFSVSATPRPGVSLAALEKGVDDVIADFIRNGPTPDEVAQAKFNLVAERAYDIDSQESLANEVGARLATGESLEHVLDWPKNIAAVTPDDVRRAARQVLDVGESVTGLLIPAPAEAKEASR
jgi:zinc protease